MPRWHWRTPENLLLLLAAASPISFAAWMSLLDNFAIHEAAFTDREIGILQSLREIWIPRICGRIRVAADGEQMAMSRC